MVVVRFYGDPKVYERIFVGRLGSVMNGDFDGHMDFRENDTKSTLLVFGGKVMCQNSRRCVDVFFWREYSSTLTFLIKTDHF